MNEEQVREIEEKHFGASALVTAWIDPQVNVQLVLRIGDSRGLLPERFSITAGLLGYMIEVSMLDERSRARRSDKKPSRLYGALHAADTGLIRFWNWESHA